MPRVVILAPWRGGEPWREHAWAIVEPFYRSLGYDFYTGDSPDAEFSLARAMNRLAAEAGDWDVALFVGADCVMRPADLERAIGYAADNQIITLPFDEYYSLTAMGARRPANNNLPFPNDRDFLAWASHWKPHYGPAGYLVMPRSEWDRIGGFDERFVGWGYEDTSLLAKAGEFHRLHGRLYHFYHPSRTRTRATWQLHQDEYKHLPIRQYLADEGRYLDREDNSFTSRMDPTVQGPEPWKRQEVKL